MYEDVAIIIPSRLGSQRLYQKPLQLIGHQTMIEWMIERVKKTGIENIFVATDSKLIAQKVEDCGVQYITTPESCDSGTDRVYEAYKTLDRDKFKYIINVQGDMPFINPTTILEVTKSLKNSPYGIITPVAKVDRDIAKSETNVKVVIDKVNRAIYFSRSIIPSEAKEFWYHVGVYGFRQDVLKEFVTLPQSSLELSERLEQLRAIENGINIGVCYVEDIPISIDTQDDLNKALNFYTAEGQNLQ
ncbi:MAG: 3-deoxy-manno-octulosonate cytidylyltransferase [Janthinobacterium lividum]